MCRSTRIRTAGLQQAYLIAYEQGQDFVTAEKWIKKRRSHRYYSTRIDDALDQLYFPMGAVDDEAVVTIIDENDEEEEYVHQSGSKRSCWATNTI